MNARVEEDVSEPDLPAYLLAALHPHGGPGAPPPTARTPAGGRPAEGGEDSDEDHSAHGGRERWRRGGRR